MTNRTFLIVAFIVAALIAAAIYMHRPRGDASRPAQHDGR
jgi:hypothetical protein